MLHELAGVMRLLEQATWGPRIDALTQVALTPQQLRLVGLLALDGPKRLTDLATQLGVSMPTVSGLLDRLSQHGMIQRTEDPLDRRAKTVQVTAKGTEALRAMLAAEFLGPIHFIRALPTDQLQALVGAVRTLVQIAQSQQDSPPPQP